jgi:ABC-type transport system involved in multi-copper enzyme maturation permease subunit
MAALWWKEWRENLYKVGVGLTLSLLLLLLRQLPTFNESFAKMVPGWAAVTGVLMAGVLAMDAVAGERTRNTLDFLRTRPLSAWQLLFPKFAVGALDLLLVMAAFWFSVYAVPLPGSGDAVAVGWVLADVPWWAMVFTWFLPLLVAYSVVFVASAATENPAEAAVAGAILAVASLLVCGLIVHLAPQSPLSELLPLMANMDMGGRGEVVRLARHGGLQAIRTTMALAVSGVALLAAWWIVSREGQLRLGRRGIVVMGFALVTSGLVVPSFLRDEPFRHVNPVGAAVLPAPGRGALVVPGLRPATVAALDARGVSLWTPPAGSDSTWQAVGDAAIPGLAVSCGEWAADRLWVAGETADGAAVGVQCLSLADSGQPRLLAATTLAAAGRAPAVVAMAALAGPDLAAAVPESATPAAVLLLVTRDDEGATVFSLSPQPDGGLTELNRLRLPDPMPARPPVAASSGGADAGVAPADPGGPAIHFAGVAIARGCVYLALRRELVTIEARRPGSLRESSRLALEPMDRSPRPANWRSALYRQVSVQGGRLLVERRWPAELVVLSIATPEQPVVVDSEDLGSPLTGSQRLGALVMRRHPHAAFGVEVRSDDALQDRPVRVLSLRNGPASPVATRESYYRSGPLLLLGDRVAVTLGDRLAAFALPADLLAAARRTVP